MDSSKILSDVEEIDKQINSSSSIDIHQLEIEYKDLYEGYPSIFKMACEGNMDFVRLKYMLQMIDRVKHNEISEHDASVDVGQKLVDEIVKPDLDSK